MSIIRWAKVTTRFGGIHSYPQAPEQVSFLRHPHRHLFWVTVWIEQFHDERDVEFLMLKNFVDTVLHVESKDWPLETSCESMAIILSERLHERYTGRRISVEVNEDGENGALIEAEW